MAADSVFHSVSEFADLIGTDHTTVGEMQVCRTGRNLDAESERERDLGFCGATVQEDRLEAPLTNGADCGIEEERVTGNGLEIGDRTVTGNDHG